MEGQSSHRSIEPSIAERPWGNLKEEARAKYTMPYCPYACKVCHKRFPTKQALGGHQNGHNQEKKYMLGYTRHVGTVPTYPRMPTAPPSFARSIFPRPHMIKAPFVPQPYHLQNPTLRIDNFTPPLDYNLIRRNNLMFPSQNPCPGHGPNNPLMRPSMPLVFPNNRGKMIPEAPCFGQSLAGNTRTSAPFLKPNPDPVTEDHLTIRQDANPALKYFFPVSTPRSVHALAPPLEAMRNDGGGKVTVNLLDSMSTPGEYSTTSGPMDDYERDELVGLDLSLHL